MAEIDLTPFSLSEVDPATSPILYHYCSTTAFLSIVQNKKFWMSDVNKLNDFGEMRWAYDRFIDAANLVLETIDREFLEQVDGYVSRIQFKILPLIFSLSSEGDVLSQWRAYANDGTGFAIGFDTKLLKKLSVTLAQTEYSREKQIEHFKAMILAGNQIYRETHGAKRKEEIIELSTHLTIDMCRFKNPGFMEEKEVRLIRASNASFDGKYWRLMDGTGVGERKSAKRQEIKYRSAANGGFIAHIELPFDGLGTGVIREVLLGPKNENSPTEVSMVLRSRNFVNFKIRRSAATYR